MTKKLPEGWREAVDKESGDVYYYNKVTKETTWTFPGEEEEKEEEKEEKIKPVKLADKAYRKQVSTEGKKMLLKTLSVVEDKKIDIETRKRTSIIKEEEDQQQQEEVEEEEVDSIESNDEDDETASLSSKITTITNSNGGKVVRRRRHSLQQMTDEWFPICFQRIGVLRMNTYFQGVRKKKEKRKTTLISFGYEGLVQNQPQPSLHCIAQARPLLNIVSFARKKTQPNLDFFLLLLTCLVGWTKKATNPSRLSGKLP